MEDTIMRTGLSSGKTDDDPEWVLDFCNFYEAWALSPKPGGKSMGEGIIIIHPDTGWTLHPELWDDNTIIDRELADDRYLVKKSKNFFMDSGQLAVAKPWQLAVDKLYTSGASIISTKEMGLKGAAKYLVNSQTTVQFRYPGHGTATASVIMSKRGAPSIDEFPFYGPELPGPFYFVSGVAPLVKVIPYRVTDTVILSARESIPLAKSIHYAARLGSSSTPLDNDGSQIGVISISLGGLDSMVKKQSLVEALKAARKAGIVVIASAGQALGKTTGGWSSPVYPGNDRNTICVAACNSKHEKYIKGFYGSSVDITAPGEKIWAARAKRVPGQFDNYYVDYGDGTSYSAAFVAGACALWQAHHGRTNLLNDYGPELIFDLFKKVLLDSCDTPSGWDTANQGAGVLDAEQLLLEPLPPKYEIEKIKGS